VLREQLGDRRLRLTNDQRRRLAAQGAAVGLAGASRSTAASCPLRRSCTGTATSSPRSTTVQFAVLPVDQRRQRSTARSQVRLGESKLKLYAHTRSASQPRPRSRPQHHQANSPRHGLDPAPDRGKRMPWKTFLKAHLGAICAVDFFSVEVLTLTGLVPSHGSPGYQPRERKSLSSVEFSVSPVSALLTRSGRQKVFSRWPSRMLKTRNFIVHGGCPFERRWSSTREESAAATSPAMRDRIRHVRRGTWERLPARFARSPCVETHPGFQHERNS
jgi:hypothetical protein